MVSLLQISEDRIELRPFWDHIGKSLTESRFFRFGDRLRVDPEALRQAWLCSLDYFVSLGEVASVVLA